MRDRVEAKASPEDDPDMHTRLMEWATWLKEAVRQGHCRSIEHRYSRGAFVNDTPTGWGDHGLYPIPGREPLPNEQEALEVERAMRYLPEMNRKALKLRYFCRGSVGWCCQRLHFPSRKFPDLINQSQRLLRSVLRLRVAAKKEASNNQSGVGA